VISEEVVNKSNHPIKNTLLLVMEPYFENILALKVDVGFHVALKEAVFLLITQISSVCAKFPFSLAYVNQPVPHPTHFNDGGGGRIFT
jgi:hypothetical protein